MKEMSLAVLIVGLLFTIIWTVVSCNTPYNIEVVVKEKMIDPGGKSGSHYLIVSTDGRIVELERQWLNLGVNVDKVWFDTKVGGHYVFECFGWVVEAFYWYPNCYKIVRVVEEEK